MTLPLQEAVRYNCRGGINMENVIEVHDLTKQYQNRIVVDHLSFEVKQGEVYGILGHNGAGKTTTIECILGLHHPEQGYATIFKQKVSKHRKQLFERIGVQLQSSSYQSNIKVKEVCEETAALYKRPQDYRMLLEQFHLSAYENQYVEKLSGGERQKLSIVTALIPNPQLIFLDELTTGLDVEARREVWETLKELKQQGMTMILTTHYMEEAQYLCDRVLLLAHGKMVKEGTVDTIIQDSGKTNLEEAYLYYMKEESK